MRTACATLCVATILFCIALVVTNFLWYEWYHEVANVDGRSFVFTINNFEDGYPRSTYEAQKFLKLAIKYKLDGRDIIYGWPKEPYVLRGEQRLDLLYDPEVDGKIGQGVVAAKVEPKQPSKMPRLNKLKVRKFR